MKYIIDTDVLKAEGFDEVVEIIECFGESLEDRTSDMGGDNNE